MNLRLFLITFLIILSFSIAYASEPIFNDLSYDIDVVENGIILINEHINVIYDNDENGLYLEYPLRTSSNVLLQDIIFDENYTKIDTDSMICIPNIEHGYSGTKQYDIKYEFFATNKYLDQSKEISFDLNLGHKNYTINNINFDIEFSKQYELSGINSNIDSSYYLINQNIINGQTNNNISTINLHLNLINPYYQNLNYKNENEVLFRQARLILYIIIVGVIIAIDIIAFFIYKSKKKNQLRNGKRKQLGMKLCALAIYFIFMTLNYMNYLSPINRIENSYIYQDLSLNQVFQVILTIFINSLLPALFTMAIILHILTTLLFVNTRDANYSKSGYVATIIANIFFSLFLTFNIPLIISLDFSYIITFLVGLASYIIIIHYGRKILYEKNISYYKTKRKNNF